MLVGSPQPKQAPGWPWGPHTAMGRATRRLWKALPAGAADWTRRPEAVVWLAEQPAVLSSGCGPEGPPGGQAPALSGVPAASCCSPPEPVFPGRAPELLRLTKRAWGLLTNLRTRSGPWKMSSFFPVSLLRIRSAQVSLKSPRPLASDSRTVGPESNPPPSPPQGLWGACDTAALVAPPACLLLFPDAGDSSPFSSPAGLGVGQPRLLLARACAPRFAAF